MKKAGFTLAEVLITLTIIGVIAALTMPSLYHNVGTADIGPKLAKFRSTVENANRLIMADREVNRLSVLLRRVQNDDRTEAYTDLLQSFMQIQHVIDPIENITTFNGDDVEQVNINLFENPDGGRAESNQIQVPLQDAFRWRTPDGMAAHFFIAPAVGGVEPDNLGVMLVDINGNDNPNRLGRDIFGFILRNDGFLTPIGGRRVDSFSLNDNVDFADDSKNWAQSCPNKQGNVIGQGLTCTGSIFANDLKVIYLN